MQLQGEGQGIKKEKKIRVQNSMHKEDYVNKFIYLPDQKWHFFL